MAVVLLPNLLWLHRPPLVTRYPCTDGVVAAVAGRASGIFFDVVPEADGGEVKQGGRGQVYKVRMWDQESS